MYIHVAQYLATYLPSLARIPSTPAECVDEKETLLQYNLSKLGLFSNCFLLSLPLPFSLCPSIIDCCLSVLEWGQLMSPPTINMMDENHLWSMPPQMGSWLFYDFRCSFSHTHTHILPAAQHVYKLTSFLAGHYPFSDASLPHLYAKIQSGYYTMPENVSWLGRMVITSLLAYDPSDRVLARVILYHPWLERNSSPPHPCLTSRLGEPLSRLGKPMMIFPCLTSKCPG